MSLILYYAPGTCALASHIALEEAGADYEARRLDFKSAEQRSGDYLRINPKGRVPALVTDRGVLTESPVILGYIAQTHPQAKLAPNDDSFAFGDLQAFNMWISSSLHPAFAHLFRPERYVDGEQHQAAVKEKCRSLVADHFEMAERTFVQGPWVTGDAYTLADPYLFTMTLWLTRVSGLPPLETYPKLADHFARMNARPAVQKVLAVHAAPA